MIAMAFQKNCYSNFNGPVSVSPHNSESALMFFSFGAMEGAKSSIKIILIVFPQKKLVW